ncbi:hypothetical protein ABFP25_01950 [Acinetobacter indicus]|uniref:Uncharacterized protein n=1 Tax=Acinetobacter indicus TaxID=756892 RepID=A0A7S7AEW2_9GAMM|nr:MULTISPECIES: hypothetical protein [Acinetobacter]QOW43432.1 hypothetical protein G0027_11620 [Acinetobacter indicus]QOW52185.1 hypothetical protein G0030_02740 [Acinetobacter indicus]
MNKPKAVSLRRIFRSYQLVIFILTFGLCLGIFCVVSNYTLEVMPNRV